MTAQLGPTDLAATVAVARGWIVASWLVAHAQTFGISAVSFDGSRWTPSSGKWKAHTPNVSRVEIERVTSA
jgi:hypothetical protein